MGAMEAVTSDPTTEVMEVRSEETELFRTETEPVMVVMAEVLFLIEPAVEMIVLGRAPTVPSTVESVEATSRTGSRLVIESTVEVASSGRLTTAPLTVETVEATSSTGSRLMVESVVEMTVSGRAPTVPSTVDSVDATSTDTGAAMA